MTSRRGGYATRLSFLDAAWTNCILIATAAFPRIVADPSVVVEGGFRLAMSQRIMNEACVILMCTFMRGMVKRSGWVSILATPSGCNSNSEIRPMPPERSYLLANDDS